MKFVEECIVKMFMLSSIIEIWDDNPTVVLTNMKYYQVPGLITCCLLSIEALCITGLSNHAHNYYLFEVIVVVILHSGLTKENH